jgi:hypothetical protein
MLPTILEYKLRQIYNTLTRGSRQKKLGWLISIAFIVPYYIVFTRSMRLRYGGSHDGSEWYATAQLDLAMVFFFVLVSTAALTLYRMFQAKDLPLLMSLPARDRSLFWAKLTESLTDAGRSMVLPFPVCLAFVSVLISRTSSPFAATIFLMGWAGVMLQLAGLSVIVALALGRAIAASRWAALLRIVAVVAALAFLLIFMSYANRAELGVSSVGARGVEEVRGQAGTWERGIGGVPLSLLCPTSWLVGLLPHVGSAVWARLLYGFGFMAITIGCPTAAYRLFRSRFRHVWTMTTEIKRRGTRKRIKRNASLVMGVMGAMGNTRAVILKETRVMWREPHIWIGLVIPLVLFPVFILFRAQASGIHEVYIIVVSLLTTTSYSLSCIGREGHSFPLLRSLPMRMSVVLRAKFSLGCAVNLTVTLVFVIALYLARRLHLNQMCHNVLTAVIVSIYLSAFGTALAALFPKFDFTNPMRAASLPGLFMLYLIVFLFGVTFIGTISVGWYFTPLVLIPWAGIALILMKVGQERLERMDI